MRRLLDTMPHYATLRGLSSSQVNVLAHRDMRQLLIRVREDPSLPES